jgi:MutS domain V
MSEKVPRHGRTSGDSRISLARLQVYESRITAHEATIGQISRAWHRLAWVRGGLFLLSVFFLFSGVLDAWQMQVLLLVAAGVLFVLFVAVACIHEGLEVRLENERTLLVLDRRRKARMLRDWPNLNIPDVAPPAGKEALSRDLDLFGKSSLFQLLGSVRTPMATELLRNWIVDVPRTETIVERQLAVAELRDDDEFRERLGYLCHRLTGSGDGPSQLLEWAESPRAFDQRGAIKWLARLMSVAMVSLIILSLAGVFTFPQAASAILVLVAANFALTVASSVRIHGQFSQVSLRNDDIHHFETAFRHLHDHPARSVLLRRLNGVLTARDSDVLTLISELRRIAWCSNLRRHGILFIAWLLLQFAFLWDFHVVERLQQWKSRNGNKVRGWLDALGNWEVLAAIGQFARDHETWKFPVIREVTAGGLQIVCRDLSHPLLNPDMAVGNDIVIGPPGTLLLVTGSNMSGKSTLLRAIGTSVVLTHLGSPVSAASMELSPMRIETSMRIQDSLSDGVSFFMAELLRLKQIVDAARTGARSADFGFLFLLDEILQGTNSRERHIAVTRVAEQLVVSGAIGAISTHDLELAEAPELREKCQPIHFRESFETRDGKKTMVFDYRARSGIATTTNALELLRLVGLDEHS